MNTELVKNHLVTRTKKQQLIFKDHVKPTTLQPLYQDWWIIKLNPTCPIKIFLSKELNVFLFLKENMLWVLIRSAWWDTSND